MKSFKNVKRIVTVLLAVLICGNVFAAERRPDRIDVKISNFHQEGNVVKFSLKFKAGLNYPFGGFRWSSLNINLDLYNTDGALNTAATTNDGVALATFGIYGSTTSSTNNPGVRPPGSVPLGIVLRRIWNDPRGDVTDTYEIVANYTIPVTGTLNPNAYIVFRETDAVGGTWGDLDGGGWSSAGDSEVRTGAFKSDKQQYHLETGCPSEALWIGDVDSDWFDSDNWANPSVEIIEGGSLPALGKVPGSCTTVYIPGSNYRGQKLTETNPIKNFPVLQEESNPTCKNIVFFQGGQIGRIDLLTYERAKVQLSLPWDYEPWTNAQPHNYGGGYFYNFAKGYSSPDLSYGKWHMLSIPMQGVVSGDLAYGGFPFTFMQKFDVAQTGADRFGDEHAEGNWSSPFTEVIEPFAPAEGLAFYAYSITDATLYHPFGFNTYYKDDENPASVYGLPYGLFCTVGIIDLPSYDHPTSLTSRRVQTYNSATKKSNFQMVEAGHDTDGTPRATFGQFTGTTYEVNRNESDYRFIIEKDGSPDYFQYPLKTSPDYVLIGNPYMSSLDFDAFADQNYGNTTTGWNKEYQIWNGSSFDSYVVGGPSTAGMTKYIPPMQGFFIKSRRTNPAPATVNSNVGFLAATMSTVTPRGTTVNLRSTSEDSETNIIRISTEHGDKTSRALIAQRADASIGFVNEEDITKLFSPSSLFPDVPEVYTTADKQSLAMNFINNVSADIPVGIRVPETGTTTLKLTGMNSYNADKIELVDGLTGEVIQDITGLDEYSYTFNNDNSGYQSSRFFLRIAQSTTGLDDVEAGKNIQVYKTKEAIQVLSSSNDKIQQVYVYDLQGRVLYSNTSVNTDTHQITGAFGSQVLLVKVVTENNTENVKIK